MAVALPQVRDHYARYQAANGDLREAASIEYKWLQTRYRSGSNRENHHVNAVFAVYFEGLGAEDWGMATARRGRRHGTRMRD